MIEGIIEDWTLERRRSNSLPNLFGMVAYDKRAASAGSGESERSEGCEMDDFGTGLCGYGAAAGGSGGPHGCRRGGSETLEDSTVDMALAMHIPYDTLMEASRSMERLQVELENREQVIRELVELRARDKSEFEQQVSLLQGQLHAERSKVRLLMQHQDQTYERQQRSMNLDSSGKGINKHRVVTGGVTVLNDTVWNNTKTEGLGDAFPFHDDFMI